jgi:hypothetical protein
MMLMIFKTSLYSELLFPYLNEQWLSCVHESCCKTKMRPIQLIQHWFCVVVQCFLQNLRSVVALMATSYVPLSTPFPS